MVLHYSLDGNPKSAVCTRWILLREEEPLGLAKVRSSMAAWSTADTE